ncbi:TetR family transcriptional regulator [Paenibacillus medicaginis]|uniref:TetR family transcriptional regulator n=1 Tax=Paenibacillus medicaginis TaxID=1470560 RepID=A0ABV5BU48_9BACL
MADSLLTKETILDATEDVLRRFGPEKTSVVDVARSLNVTHGTIYRHFPSKSALRLAVVKRWFHVITEPLDKTFQLECSASERLRIWMDTLIRIKHTKAQQDPEMFAIYTEIAEESDDIANEFVNHIISSITKIVEAGISNHEFKEGIAEDIARGIYLSTIRFHHPLHSREWLIPTIQQEYDVVWNLIMSGILQ